MIVHYFKTIYGFTLIETLISVLLTAIICSTLMLGITQAKLYLGSIRVKERAYTELTNYTNKWKSLLAGGYGVPGNSFQEGFPVVLKKDSKGNPIVSGKMFKRINKSNKSGKYSIFYDIETYIVWDNKNFFFNQSATDTIKFKTHQILFNTQ